MVPVALCFPLESLCLGTLGSQLGPDFTPWPADQSSLHVSPVIQDTAPAPERRTAWCNVQDKTSRIILSPRHSSELPEEILLNSLKPSAFRQQTGREQRWLSAPPRSGNTCGSQSSAPALAADCVRDPRHILSFLEPMLRSDAVTCH